MNSIVRNFVFVISRFKMASFLNVAGLSVAFTAFLILFMQVRYEWDTIVSISMPTVCISWRSFTIIKGRKSY